VRRKTRRPAPQQIEAPKLAGMGLRRAAARAAESDRPEKSYEWPVQPPQLLKGVVPAGVTAPVMAQDSPAYTMAAHAFPGGGFPGFAYLSQLATRPEFRQMAAALSTELTREWIEFTSSQDDGAGSADRITAIEAEFKRLNVRGVIQRAAEHDAFFGRAQVFLDIRGADRATPLILDPRTIQPGSLQGVATVEAVWTTPATYNALDPVAPDFYRPPKWFMLGQEVHASRLMTVVTRPLPDILKPAFNFAGMSLSQLAEPYVDNWLRTRQSVSDLLNNFSITALATSMDQVLQGDDDGASLFARAKLFTATRSNKGLMLLDKEREEIVQINTPLSGLHELQAQSQEHMCLSKGTLIETRRGQIPIEFVKENDEVMTRDGYAPVEWAGVTGTTSSFVEIDSGGSILRATKEHPIWLETTQEFVPAKNVHHSSFLRKSPAWESMGNPLHGEGAYGATQNKDITEIQKQEGCCTGLFMKPISAPFLRGLMFITKTKTRATTQLKTWFCSQEQSTQQSMTQKVGTSNLMALCMKKFVNNVGLIFKPHGPTEANFAQTNANKKHSKLESGIKQIRELRLFQDEPVYNIKVKDGFLPEFFANGILVHNCSVSRLPSVILTGISPSGLNASSDGEIRIFYDWIAAQQEAHWRAPIEVILKAVQLSLFGETDPDIGFEFVPLYQMTPAEEADIRAKDCTTACAYVDHSILDPSEVRQKLARDPASGFHGIDADAEIVPPVDPANGMDPAQADDESVSEAQRRAMEAAAHGRSTIGIPKSVGKEFARADEA